MIVVNLDVMMAKRKMSLSQLSEKVDITLANLSILKNNKAKAVRFSTLEAICAALDCQPGDILEFVPDEEATATKFDDITYDEVLRRGLKVMDLTATCMCKENNLPIIVFDMDTLGNLKKVMTGESIGTLVHN